MAEKLPLVRQLTGNRCCKKNYTVYVFQVIPRVDGLICYMDATCRCETSENSNTGAKKQIGCGSDSHAIDVLELEAMMRTIPPDLTPPILVLLAHMDDQKPASSDSDPEDNYTDSNSQALRKDPIHLSSQKARHCPAMLYKLLETLDLPWAVSMR